MVVRFLGPELGGTVGIAEIRGLRNYGIKRGPGQNSGIIRIIGIQSCQSRYGHDTVPEKPEAIIGKFAIECDRPVF